MLNDRGRAFCSNPEERGILEKIGEGLFSRVTKATELMTQHAFLFFAIFTKTLVFGHTLLAASHFLPNFKSILLFL